MVSIADELLANAIEIGRTHGPEYETLYRLGMYRIAAHTQAAVIQADLNKVYGIGRSIMMASPPELVKIATENYFKKDLLIEPLKELKSKQATRSTGALEDDIPDSVYLDAQAKMGPVFAIMFTFVAPLTRENIAPEVIRVQQIMLDIVEDELGILSTAFEKANKDIRAYSTAIDLLTNTINRKKNPRGAPPTTYSMKDILTGNATPEYVSITPSQIDQDVACEILGDETVTSTQLRAFSNSQPWSAPNIYIQQEIMAILEQLPEIEPSIRERIVGITMNEDFTESDAKVIDDLLTAVHKAVSQRPTGIFPPDTDIAAMNSTLESMKEDLREYLDDGRSRKTGGLDDNAGVTGFNILSNIIAMTDSDTNAVVVMGSVAFTLVILTVFMMATGSKKQANYGLFSAFRVIFSITRAINVIAVAADFIFLQSGNGAPRFAKAMGLINSSLHITLGLTTGVFGIRDLTKRTIGKERYDALYSTGRTVITSKHFKSAMVAVGTSVLYATMTNQEVLVRALTTLVTEYILPGSGAVVNKVGLIAQATTVAKRMHGSVQDLDTSLYEKTVGLVTIDMTNDLSKPLWDWFANFMLLKGIGNTDMPYENIVAYFGLVLFFGLFVPGNEGDYATKEGMNRKAMSMLNHARAGYTFASAIIANTPQEDIIIEGIDIKAQLPSKTDILQPLLTVMYRICISRFLQGLGIQVLMAAGAKDALFIRQIMDSVVTLPQLYEDVMQLIELDPLGKTKEERTRRDILATETSAQKLIIGEVTKIRQPDSPDTSFCLAALTTVLSWGGMYMERKAIGDIVHLGIPDGPNSPAIPLTRYIEVKGPEVIRSFLSQQRTKIYDFVKTFNEQNVYRSTLSDSFQISSGTSGWDKQKADSILEMENAILQNQIERQEWMIKTIPGTIPDVIIRPLHQIATLFALKKLVSSEAISTKTDEASRNRIMATINKNIMDAYRSILNPTINAALYEHILSKHLKVPTYYFHRHEAEDIGTFTNLLSLYDPFTKRAERAWTEVNGSGIHTIGRWWGEITDSIQKELVTYFNISETLPQETRTSRNTTIRLLSKAVILQLPDLSSNSVSIAPAYFGLPATILAILSGQSISNFINTTWGDLHVVFKTYTNGKLCTCWIDILKLVKCDENLIRWAGSQIKENAITNGLDPGLYDHLNYYMRFLIDIVHRIMNDAVRTTIHTQLATLVGLRLNLGQNVVAATEAMANIQFANPKQAIFPPLDNPNEIIAALTSAWKEHREKRLNQKDDTSLFKRAQNTLATDTTFDKLSEITARAKRLIATFGSRHIPAGYLRLPHADYINDLKKVSSKEEALAFDMSQGWVESDNLNNKTLHEGYFIPPNGI